MAESKAVIEQIKEALFSAQESWGEEIENPALLKGFYICADYATLEGQHIFFALSSNGGGDALPAWTVEGYLNYALSRGHLGVPCSCEDCGSHREGEDE